MTAIIEIKNLSKIYGGVPAVDQATMAIESGEIIGFVGLNGAGKSTTINMLLGFIAPTAGEVQLFGQKVTLPNAAKSHRRIGFATGDMSLFETMTGRQYLRFVAKTHKKKLEATSFKALCERFQPQLDKKLADLSRGNKQKIALIAAFMNNPELVILDEPSSGLDPLMQQHFIDLVREEAAKGVTIFMSSHYLNEVVDVCTRIVLIKDGKITKDIPASELESASGKLVRVVTKEKVNPPKTATAVESARQGDTHLLQFVYKEKALRLQEWLGSLPHLQDLTISDHGVEAAFEDLYGNDASEVEEGK